MSNFALKKILESNGEDSDHVILTQNHDENLYIVMGTSGGALGNPEYIAYGQPGTLLASPRWKAKKITYSSDGNITRIQWADGNSDFDNVATNLSELSYS